MADEKNDKRASNHRQERGRFADRAERGRRAKAQPDQPAQPTAQAQQATRDRFAEHVDAYVFSSRPGDKKLRFEATFTHCGQAMSERPTQMTVSLDPETPSQGVCARLKCDVCGWKLRIEIVPENGNGEGNVGT